MSTLIRNIWARYSTAYNAIKHDDVFSLNTCISRCEYDLPEQNLLMDTFDIHYLTGYKLLEMIVKFDAVRCMSLMVQVYGCIIHPLFLHLVLKHDSHKILNYLLERHVEVNPNFLRVILENDSSYCLELLYNKDVISVEQLLDSRDLLVKSTSCYGFWLSVIKPTILKPHSRL